MLGPRGGGDEAVSQRNAGEGSRLRARARAAFQNKLESAEGRKSGKVMIMKNFKASLLFVPSLARSLLRPIGVRRRGGEESRAGEEGRKEGRKAGNAGGGVDFVRSAAAAG